MSQVKFKSMVRPGTTLTMTLKFDPDAEKLHYSIANADSVSASGIMIARTKDD
jgi:3-hydroxymyristoyl/3-hydroxydecanoyl-(acyl carrier protein) dehydratase